MPPLCINFVDRLLIRKHTLHKKMGRTEATFTDDGFALGLAYILRLLDLDALFASLHWFESVQDHCNSKIKELNELKSKKDKSKNNNEESLQQFHLTQKRIFDVQREFELLHYTFDGARIFFREQPVPETPAEDEQTQAAPQDEKHAQGSAPASQPGPAPGPPAPGPPGPPGPPGMFPF